MILTLVITQDLLQQVPQKPPSTIATPIFFPEPLASRRPTEEKSPTTCNGETAYKGQVKFYDNFDGQSISNLKWKHADKIADEPVSINFIYSL